MRPEDYIQRELGTGRLQYAHIAEIVRFWQSAHGLQADGLPGRRTVEAIEAAMSPPPAEADWALFQERAVDVALGQLGQGEEGSNNRGEAVYRYRRGDGTGGPWDIAGPWCASFASWCLVQAANGLGYALPFDTSRGAKLLTERVAKAGRRCAIPEVNAVICWHRSRLGALSRKGHVGFVLEYDPGTDTIVTIEGNKNRRGERFATVEKFHYPRGRWRRGLYLLATMAPR